MLTVFEVQQNYGHTRFFPANEVAEKIAKLAGQKSLTPDDMQIVKELGFEVELKAPDVSRVLDKKKGK